MKRGSRKSSSSSSKDGKIKSKTKTLNESKQIKERHTKIKSLQLEIIKLEQQTFKKPKTFMDMK